MPYVISCFAIFMLCLSTCSCYQQNVMFEQYMYQENLIANSTTDDGPPPPQQVAKMARYIMHKSNWASMATISVRPPTAGQPFSNMFSVSDGPINKSTGIPYMYLTDMEMSCQDLLVNPHASLSMTLAQSSYCRENNYDPQSPLCARLILNGKVVPVKVNTKEEQFAKRALFTRHREMADWPTDHKFYVGKLDISSVCVLDFFGGAKYVPLDDYFNAKI